MESWPSGLRHLTANETQVNPYREFESLTLRQLYEDDMLTDNQTTNRLKCKTCSFYSQGFMYDKCGSPDTKYNYTDLNIKLFGSCEEFKLRPFHRLKAWLEKFI